MFERKNWTYQKLTPNVNINQVQKEVRFCTPTKLRFQGAKNNTPLIDAKETAVQARKKFTFKTHIEDQVNPLLMECRCMRDARPCSLMHICEDDKTKNNTTVRCTGCPNCVKRDGKQKLKTCRGGCLMKSYFCHQCYDDDDDKVHYCVYKTELKNFINSESNGQRQQTTTRYLKKN